MTGKVLNHDDAQPIANANVFLNNTTIGAKTAANGAFTLFNVKPGKYDLTVSIIGYSSYSQAIAITNSNINLPGILLNPKVMELSVVTIKPKDDSEWQRNLELFKNDFLGTSDLAKDCKIVNPELLDLAYDEKTQTLSAKSADYLVIENQALGYRIKYLLSDFSCDQLTKQFLYGGSVFFEELKGTTVQLEEWKEKRKAVYANSVTHFLRAALNNQLSREGFFVLRYQINPQRPTDSIISQRIRLFTLLKNKHEYRDSLSYWENKSNLPRLLPRQVPDAFTAEDFIAQTNKPGLYTFSCGNDALYVVYDESRKFKASSLSHLYAENNTSNTLIVFKGPVAYFDGRGVIVNPESLAYAGVWAGKRIAELLPVNYEPPQTDVADSTLVKKIDFALKEYTIGHPVEKAYLHLDKPYYAAGDTIYFKAYVTDELHQLTSVSNALNVELISPGNKISSSVKLKLIDGTAAGDFALADSLEGGSYRLRAYPNLMRNAGEAYFFDQYLSVINEPSKIPQAQKAKKISGNQKIEPPQHKAVTPGIDIQFFPEGGNLLTGVTSKIAFKAVAANGLGADVKGTVIDEQGHMVCSFASRRLGMGTITMKPEPGKTYKAKVNGPDSTRTFNLPETDDKGFALNIDNADPRSVSVNVVAGRQNHQAQVNLVAQSGGIIYSYIPGKLVNNSFTAIIPKSKFPDGIVQFTLFSANGEPMNERLVFVRNPDQLNLKLSTGNQVYHPRQKVSISLSATGRDNEPSAGTFSVAVTDESRLPADGDNESTILSNLLLTSDLKGYVEKPNYYFNGGDQANADLDVLMLTQGYHRFDWKQVLNGKYPPAAFKAEEPMTISGKLKTLAGKAVPYGKVSMLSVTKGFVSLDTTADANGVFVFEHFPVLDSMRYIIQATDKRVRKNSVIELNYGTSPEPGVNKNSLDTVENNESKANYYSFSKRFHAAQISQGVVKHTIQLKEVEIREKKVQKYLRNSANLNGPGNADQVITADQIPLGCPTFISCIVGYLHGIKYALGNFYYGFFPTLVLLDGIEIPGNLIISNGQFQINKRASSSQADILNSIVPSDIASIEIVKNASLAAIYGVRGGGGVIIITTKRWEDVTEPAKNLKRNFAYYTPVGYCKAKVFYSPKYDVPASNLTAPDLRTTIYWNPAVVTGNNGKTSFEFFNADTKGTYRVVVEGIDDNGNVGRAVYRYEVK